LLFHGLPRFGLQGFSAFFSGANLRFFPAAPEDLPDQSAEEHHGGDDLKGDNGCNEKEKDDGHQVAILTNPRQAAEKNRSVRNQGYDEAADEFLFHDLPPLAGCSAFALT
jgi:hypothetical protein